MKLAHIITDLSIGGAEMMLYKLLSGIEREKSQMIVISLMDMGILGERIEAMGIHVYPIGLTQGKIPSLFSVLKIKRIIDDFCPDLVQGWMYHGNLAASFIRWISWRRKPAVLWNIRQSIDNYMGEKRLTKAMIRMGAFLSFGTDGIIYNARSSEKQHVCMGFSQNKSIVIPNGFDLHVLIPDAKAGDSIRKELGIDREELLVGLIGRYHPMKDHANFIKAASLVINKSKLKNVKFLFAGRNVDWENASLAGVIADHGLRPYFHLLGERTDIPQIMASLDVAVLSSSSEAFPNVVGEAMACGVPCVVTDVGDASFIVGDTGKVVPVRNPNALAGAVLYFLQAEEEERKKIGLSARQRIKEHFSLQAIVRKYENLYQSVLDRAI